jgi:hypothetical protein
MATERNNDELMAALQEPFLPEDIEWRVQQAGETNGKLWAQVLAYVTNRAIQQRLDDVFGIAGWQNKYENAPQGGVMCGISVKFDEWVTKWDGAENTAMEAVKGGLSGSMKRAAVQWGIGRYLYFLEVNFAETSKDKPNNMDGWIRTRAKLNKNDQYPTTFYFKIPTLPAFALPTGYIEPKAPNPFAPEANQTATESTKRDFTKPSENQLKTIASVCKDLGISEQDVVAKIAQLNTVTDATKLITNLQRIKEERGARSEK